MPTKTQLFHQLIAPLQLLMELSGRAYQKYLQHKIFLHAETLRISNKKIQNLLVEKAGLIPEELKEASLQLLSHYDSWLTHFRVHQEKANAGPVDDFVFKQADGQYRYPVKAEQQVNQYYLKLKQELTTASLLEQ